MTPPRILALASLIFAVPKMPVSTAADPAFIRPQAGSAAPRTRSSGRSPRLRPRPAHSHRPKADNRRYDGIFAAGDHLILLDSIHRKTAELRRPEIIDADSAAITTCGKHIAFAALNKKTGWKSIYVADAPDFVPRQVATQAGWQESPSFSPDGTRLAFAMNRLSHGPRAHIHDDFGQIYEQDLATNRLRAVTNETLCHLDPAYSADGKSIFAENTDCGAVWHITRVDLTSGSQTLVTHDLMDREGVPSPDGKHLAYVHVLGSTASITLSNADGTGARSIAPVPPNEKVALQWVTEGGALAWRSEGRISIHSLATQRTVVLEKGSSL